MNATVERFHHAGQPFLVLCFHSNGVVKAGTVDGMFWCFKLNKLVEAFQAYSRLTYLHL